MTSVLRTPASAVWLALLAATGLSWALGTGHALSERDSATSSVLILVLAFVKVRFVGLYFMELKDAPGPLRWLFEGYCLVVCGLVTGMFLVA